MLHNCPWMFPCTKKRFVKFSLGSVRNCRRPEARARELSEHAGGVAVGAVAPWRHIVHSKSRAATNRRTACRPPRLFNKCLYVSLAPVLFQSSVPHCVILDLSPIPTFKQSVLAYNVLKKTKTKKKVTSLCFNIAKNLVTNSDTIQREIK